MIGVPLREEVFEDFVPQQAIGIIVALAFFVLDDAALVIELFLRHRAEQMAHAVAFEEQRAVERAGRHRFEIVGAVGIGRAVEIGRANLLQRFKEVARRIFRTVEHQMFEQMRKTRLARGFVLRSDAIPDRHRDDRRLVIFVHDHAQSVVEREALVRNIDRLHQFGNRRGLRLLGFGKGGAGRDERRRYGQGDGKAMEAGHGYPLETGGTKRAGDEHAGRHCINGLGQLCCAFKADRIALRSREAPPDRKAPASTDARRTGAPDRCNADFPVASSRHRRAAPIPNGRVPPCPTSRT